MPVSACQRTEKSALTPLPTGKVLVPGGFSSDTRTLLSSVESYDFVGR